MTAIFDRKSRKGFRGGPPSPDPEPTEFLPAHYHHRTAKGWPVFPEPPRGRVLRKPPPQPVGGELTDVPIVWSRMLAGWLLQPHPGCAIYGRVTRGPSPQAPLNQGWCIEAGGIWVTGAVAGQIAGAGAVAGQIGC